MGSRVILTEADLRDELLRTNAQVWHSRLTAGDIDSWLDNFSGESPLGTVSAERMNALHLLSQFMFFGEQELRVLLKALYRDLFRYPLLQEIRNRLGATATAVEVERDYLERLRNSRFLGMGNPSESGAHLLYYFRQENGLPKELFVNEHELFSGPPSGCRTRLANPSLERVVFIDDLLGSGQQSVSYSENFLSDLKRIGKRSRSSLVADYLVLFAKPAGLARARATKFDRVDAVHTLDASQDAFGDNSRAYKMTPPGVSKSEGRVIAKHYGAKIAAGHSLGYQDGQMLLGLNHNVPDNTLPIFWGDGGRVSWRPIFSRYHKESWAP